MTDPKSISSGEPSSAGPPSGPLSCVRLQNAWRNHWRQELYAPAEALVGYCRMLAEDVVTGGPAEFTAAVADMNRTSLQLLRMVDDLLDLAHMEAERQAADRENFRRKMRHDLRAKPSVIIGLCEMWMEDADEFLLDKFVPDLQTIQSAAQNVVDSIDKLVNFSDQAEPTTGTIWLPPEVKTLPLDPIRQNGRILVVDDNPHSRHYLCRAFERQGHRVAAVPDGALALERIAAEPFDVILLDLVMPGMSGFEVLDRLKEDPQSRHIPVIVISALNEVDGVIRCIARGADDYLSRPFNQMMLSARVGACLEKKRLHDQQVEHLRTIDQLLHVIVPSEVVPELKETGTLKPTRHDKVGVMFLDIVGFTSYCDGHGPEEVVARLQELVLGFEEIASRHGVQKIKTIGDAFMAAAGLLRPDPNPVLTLLRCADEMVLAAANSAAGWDVRIGIHAGPVVAGVLGRTQFTYDLWGDTVNTAARMESHGEKGRITLSGEAWSDVEHLCQGEVALIPVKGLGERSIVRFCGFCRAEPS